MRVTIQPLGPVGPNGSPSPGPTQQAQESTFVTGREQSYRLLTSTPLHVPATASPHGGIRPYTFAPVGTFDLNTLRLPDNPLNYVPVGAYDPPGATLVSNGSQVHPTTNPAGLLQSPPLAIANLSDATSLRPGAPIDAIRVRVSGVKGYTSAGRERVERTATAIRAIGLNVDIVAGSSPQRALVNVPAYYVDETPPRDLGVVSQTWTTLGAAQRVDHGLGFTTGSLLLLALATATIAVAAMQALQSATGQREVALLKSLNWTRRRIVSWTAQESLAAGLSICAASVVTWAITNRSLFGLGAGLAIGLLFPVAALAATWTTLGNVARRHRDVLQGGDIRVDRRSLTGPAVTSRSGYGLRAFLARPARSNVIVAAVGVTAIAAGLAAAVLAGVLGRVGPTLLASSLSAAVRPYQMVLLVATVLTGATVSGLMLRFDAHSRRREFRVHESSGWTRRDVRRALRFQLALGATVAALVATMAVVALAGPMFDASPYIAGAVTLMVSLSCVAWGELFVRRTGGAQ